MTTERQRTANRANAQRSSGPKTIAGKARAAANSRRHGLTALPPYDLVLRWYQLILDDPEVVPYPFEKDPYRRAARDLAEAEAQLCRVRSAEEVNLEPPADEPNEAELLMKQERRKILEALEGAEWEQEFFGQLPRVRRKDFVQSPRTYRSWRRKGENLFWRMWVHERREAARRRNSQLAAWQRQVRLLARYRTAAENRRRKALHRWVAEISKRSQFRP